ncbi:hypothetical protein ACJX0J_027483, partial [Zea mays]
PRKDKENVAGMVASPSKEAYRRLLARKLFNNQTQILAFRNKLPEPENVSITNSAERTVNAPELVDDYYLNLLDWGSNNVMSIALGNTGCLRDASSGSTSELAPDGRHIAVGINSSDVQLWDTSSNRLPRTLRGVHEARVGSLAWNNSILAWMARLHTRGTFGIRAAAGQEVCGLKWSGAGQQLASGGNDNLLHIWRILNPAFHHEKIK